MILYNIDYTSFSTKTTTMLTKTEMVKSSAMGFTLALFGGICAVVLVLMCIVTSVPLNCIDLLF